MVLRSRRDIMKSRVVLIISGILVVMTMLLIIFNSKSSNSKYIDDFIDIELSNKSVESIPNIISESKAWKDFTESEYFSFEQDYLFDVSEDRIISEMHNDDYYIHIEYVFEELAIVVYDINTMDVIKRFE